MSTHESEAVNPMDGIETLVRTRFEAVVGDIDLDVPSLVNAGTTTGQRMRRNRRIVRGSVAVAGVAVLATLAGIGLSGGLLDNSAPPVKPDNVQELVPSNSQAEAAAVIADLPPGLVPGAWREQANKPRSGSIGVSTSGRWEGNLFNLTAEAQPLPPHTPALDCVGRSSPPPNAESCRILPLAGGAQARLDVVSQGLPGTQGSSVYLLALVIRADSFESLEWNVSNASQSQLDQMKATALRFIHDPAVGLTTYPRFIDTQGTVPGFCPFTTRTPPTC